MTTLAERLLALPRPLLLGLDVDGTLAPIVTDPEAARVPEATQAILRGLASRPDIHVAFVTGRDLDGLARMLDVPGAWRSVEHGSWIAAPSAVPEPPALSDADRKKLDALARWIEASPARLERKARAVALHTRGMPDSEGAHWMAEGERRARELGLHPRLGRCVMEAEVEIGDKGVALRLLHARTGAASVFFAGDDLTDGPAIRYAATHGIGVWVGARGAQASPDEARVAGVEDVTGLLRSLEG